MKIIKFFLILKNNYGIIIIINPLEVDFMIEIELYVLYLQHILTKTTDKRLILTIEKILNEKELIKWKDLI